MAAPMYPEVDLLIQKGNKPIGAFFQKNLDSGGVMLMVEKNHLFPDQRNRSLIETAV